ncbi:hypothetical protein SDC9_139649 [bioreactor metagenome]|uniref:Uncharacterized protein n=1 Tax=bioreactor metagenome TaxID=1076179 RepID=A0A645DSP9_9ZZZZ
MKFAIGYQQTENGEPFSDIVRDYREAVAEVYFPWPGMAGGRAALGRRRGGADWSSQERLEAELRAIRALGVRLDLLFNANCYGEYAVSVKLANEVGSILDYLAGRELLPEVVTTTSPFIAAVIRKHFPGVELRASVNLRIDSTLAMEYMSDSFDSFHIRRDLQRDLDTVARFHRWCREHGKTLCLLANSGCLRHCPAQTFHDNLVAHDAAIDEVKNLPGFEPHLCWKLYRDPAHFVEFLRGSWLRPEDLKAYEPFFATVKLATRQHLHPRMVIGAYAAGYYDGNLLDLMEPCFSPIFTPHVIDNRAFPDDWLTAARGCATDCRHCGRCEAVLARVLARAAE